ncbi:hypothetical protein RF11_12461 [Thelohanellus kitauei]|uniref:Uncharacterized protein n=1 Tax=Thelohanellus kitauei TaxID=669202 RepID=A0A0C2NGE0_THEKT|nr:hypothetical protein RF11_12461 [Thelohanellus kitauei]
MTAIKTYIRTFGEYRYADFTNSEFIRKPIECVRKSVEYNEVCGYTLADEHFKAKPYNRKLASENYLASIHGDFSEQWNKRDQKPCDVDNNVVVPRQLWFPFHEECRKHRFRHETFADFTGRVLNTCTSFEGHLESVNCRFDEDRGHNISEKDYVSEHIPALIILVFLHPWENKYKLIEQGDI